METLKDLMRHKRDGLNDAPEMDLNPHKKILEEDMPHGVDHSQVGRLRLVQAYRRKFGADYLSVPVVKNAMDHFEKESEFMKLYHRTIGARNGR